MNWVALVLWGGWVGADTTSFAQVMISRPIVAATGAGLILGRPVEGLTVGVLLEIFALIILPIGAARYPEYGTAAVAACAGYVHAVTEGAPAAGALFLAVAFGLLWERVAGATVTALRRANERLVAGAAEQGAFTAGRLERLHLAALGADFARAALLVRGGRGRALLLLRFAGPVWAIGESATAGALAVAAATMLAGRQALVDGWAGRRVTFGLGLLCGLAILLSR